ncbi:unnamed protein product [Vitrella brassicaformis CCMP3155]|uniref:Uncharacterized protein n=1 Tax=Vitrella brassicaformis (strain CCMP3155) TaxID=1169540 RepID=A0A0G4H1H8_VITBC|nr:unnamed protein product [Vitrella brassicaformis CCMP3155]|eukprot:CEM37457.1 unnamed protein product [Vitrella brassicaformis CCMP3155]
MSSCRGDAATAASSASAGASVESDEERQRREESQRPLRKKISDTVIQDIDCRPVCCVVVFQEGLLSYMMAFLPINLMVQLARSIWEKAAPDLSDVTISSATKEERSFWQHVHLASIAQLAARLTRLTSITLRYPLGSPMWCFDVLVEMVERQHGAALETIIIEGVRLTGTARQTGARTHPPLPAPLDPPPTLHALTTIAGLTDDHWQLADRRWLMPSLAVARRERWGADRLGQFISTSHSLRRVDGSFRGGEWAGVFEGIPAAPAGQRGGPLSNLESIGTIVVEGSDPAGIDRLQEVMLARGCRGSLKQLHVEFDAGSGPTGRHVLSTKRPTHT